MWLVLVYILMSDCSEALVDWSNLSLRRGGSRFLRLLTWGVFRLDRFLRLLRLLRLLALLFVNNLVAKSLELWESITALKSSLLG